MKETADNFTPAMIIILMEKFIREILQDTKSEIMESFMVPKDPWELLYLIWVSMLLC